MLAGACMAAVWRTRSSDDLRLQFEAVSQFPEVERRIVKALLEGMIMALCPLRVEDAERRQQQAFRRRDAPAIERPAPAQVVGQVARGDSVKAGQPLPAPSATACGGFFWRCSR